MGPQEPEVRVDVVLRGDSVDDQIEAPRELGEGGLVARDREVLGAEALGVGLFGARGAEHRDVGAHGRRELHAHVAEAAEAEHRHAITLLAVPLTEGRVGGDPGAEQRRRARGIERLRHLENEVLGDHDLGGVAAVGRRLPIHLGAVVGLRRALLAELLVVQAAVAAVAARVDHAPHAGEITHLEPGDLRAHARHAADDLVPRHHREDRVAPLPAGLMDVRVTDTAEQDLDEHVARADFAAIDPERSESLVCSGCTVGEGLHVGLQRVGCRRDYGAVDLQEKMVNP